VSKRAKTGKAGLLGIPPPQFSLEDLQKFPTLKRINRACAFLDARAKKVFGLPSGDNERFLAVLNDTLDAFFADRDPVYILCDNNTTWESLLQAFLRTIRHRLGRYRRRKKDWRTAVFICRNDACVFATIRRDYTELHSMIVSDVPGVGEYEEPRDSVLKSMVAHAAKEQAKQLSWAIDQLDDLQKRVVCLKLEGYTQKEISKRLGVSEACISKHNAHALRRLHQLLI
jgi:RNA polymerase sigma factor (sigma-70 family)